MRIWLITDTHFNHQKVIEYCDRPKNFEELLWKSLGELTSDDMLIHLGDICIGNDVLVHERLSKLPCRKILVKGNHDKQSSHWYATHGWDFVCESVVLEVCNKKILLTHIPQKKTDAWDYNIHGHFHNRQYRVTESHSIYKPEYHLRLACELTKYKPVLLESIVNKPASYRVEVIKE